MTEDRTPSPDLDVAIVGAGLGGIYALHRLRSDGWNVRVFEAGSGVGGTWFWNRYPGARCDVESADYSFSFSPELEQEWEWTERYPAQPSILAYINHVADRFDLRRDIELDVNIVEAEYDEDRRCWTLTTQDGRRVRARFCVMATGCLSAVNWPAIDGLDSFRGQLLHTARWPADRVDLAGRRVGVIGTGSTGIQLIPRLAQDVGELHVFQRTANYSIPAVNRPLGAEERARIKATYRERRRLNRNARSGIHVERNPQRVSEATPSERSAQFEQRWIRGGGTQFLAAYSDILADLEANEQAAEFVRRKIRQVVRDPAVAELLSPRDHPIGSKRICVDTGYYATFNRPNVGLIDLRAEPIVRIEPLGVRTSTRLVELDALVVATGFDALSGALLRIDIRGRGGRRLRDRWADGPSSYLGLTMHGFPNLFTVTGPGSPSVLVNMVLAIEQHVDWIADALGHMRQHGHAEVEATADAEQDWSKHLAELAAPTMYHRADSWFVGANVPGKPRALYIYTGGLDRYIGECGQVVADGYRGLTMRPPRPRESD